MRLRRPDRDTVLYPEIAYPTYEMGAILAGCRAVAVPLGADGRLMLDAVAESDAARALALWVELARQSDGGVRRSRRDRRLGPGPGHPRVQ